jgi:quinol monooxygenase YgiN
VVIVTIKIKVPNKTNKEFTQTLSALSKATLKKDGCLNYNIYKEIDGENNYSLVLEWKSWKDWEKYLLSDQFIVFRGAMSLLEKVPDIQFSNTSYQKEARAIKDDLDVHFARVESF